ncbi:bacteriocin [Chryseobacterium lactis]|uniref:bacteriocin n=1 Tax=Chryseobacterium lactis TaxID=1241981 RepID=UPI001627F164|nr:bacteriocin [Chryseobacterium lactis]
MKNLLEQAGKKLNKKELKSITGGLLNCIEPTPTFCPDPPCQGGSRCKITSSSCAQLECRPNHPIEF